MSNGKDDNEPKRPKLTVVSSDPPKEEPKVKKSGRGKSKEVDPPPTTTITVPESPNAISDEEMNELIGIMDPKAIETLDVAALREKMLKSIFVLQAGLWGQAGFESNRLANNRKLTATLEKELFSPEKVAAMNPEQKIRLYQIIQNNMNNSLNFFQNLHASVNTGIDTLSKLDKMKSERPRVTDEKTDNQKASLQDIRAGILDRIKGKSETTTKGKKK